MFLINGQKLKFGIFPNHESYADLVPLDKKVTIVWKFENDGEFIQLKFLKDYLAELQIKAALVIPYLPYSRMDRQEESRFFTLKSTCRFINDLNFETVTLWEPHSDVCVALLDRVKVINKTKELALLAIADLVGLSATTTSETVLLKRASEMGIYLVYPDAGAAKRYQKQFFYPYTIECSKERDFLTGRIKSLSLLGAENVTGKIAIILDDLCSRGGTFQLTATKLREQCQFENIILVVTHCEDTIFDGEVLTENLIQQVYTTQSILSRIHEKIFVEAV